MVGAFFLAHSRARPSSSVEAGHASFPSSLRQRVGEQMNRAFLASASLLIWSSLAVGQAFAGQTPDRAPTSHPAAQAPVQQLPSTPPKPPVDPALKSALEGVEASNPV